MHEYPICLIDAVRSNAESQLLASIGTGNNVRLAEQNLGTVIRNKYQNLNLDLSKCVGQRMDGTSNMSSETKGAEVSIRQDGPMILYFHFVMHCLNLCTSQSVNVASIRNCIDVVREIM